MLKRFLIFSFLMSLFIGSTAKVKLSHLISDNMIIQQQSDARLWGWDKPGKTIVVSTSWSTEKYKTETSKDGKWIVTVKTPKASFEPLSITFDDGEKTTVSNILAGDVWVCAGQSNMEMPVRGFGSCPVDNVNNVVLDAANNKGVRHVKINSVMSMTPLEDSNCEWKPCDAENVLSTSATGYFFARLLSRTLNIPVGIIEANKGGTRVEAWLSEDNLRKHTKEQLDSVSIYKKGEMERQLVWGNGTFNPILKYTVKGILWYQGCSNVSAKCGEYADRLALLVKQWRDSFGEGDIPFYFVQITPYWYDNVDGISSALLREQQFKASKLITNSGIICTNDCVYPYEAEQIHPAQKQKVGERLAMMALNKTYGMKQLIVDSPTFKSMKINNDEVIVSLNNLADGVSRMRFIEGFEVAGADKVFHKATANYVWRNEALIIVKSPEVSKPVAVRYCFRNFMLGNLGNQGGLPLFPFRSDNW